MVVPFYWTSDFMRWCKEHRRICYHAGDGTHRPAFRDTWFAIDRLARGIGIGKEAQQ